MLTNIGPQMEYIQDYNILQNTGLCHSIEGDHKVKKRKCSKDALRLGTNFYKTSGNSSTLVCWYTVPPNGKEHPDKQ